MSIILASSSHYRRELLERLHLPFSCISPDIDESPLPDEQPQSLVRRLAVTKARAVFAQHSASVVIGADQIAVHGEAIIGKPGNLASCAIQLRRLSGQRVTYTTGLAVIGPGAVEDVAHHSCHLTYRRLSDAQIGQYLTLEQPLDCAGSLKAEGLGIALVDRLMSDDPSSIIGLPLITLLKMLRKLGVDPLNADL